MEGKGISGPIFVVFEFWPEDSSLPTQLALTVEGIACSCPRARSDLQPRFMGFWPGVPAFRGTLQSLPTV